jgi:hypothetical protein
VPTTLLKVLPGAQKNKKRPSARKKFGNFNEYCLGGNNEAIQNVVSHKVAEFCCGILPTNFFIKNRCRSSSVLLLLLLLLLMLMLMMLLLLLLWIIIWFIVVDDAVVVVVDKCNIVKLPIGNHLL